MLPPEAVQFPDLEWIRLWSDLVQWAAVLVLTIFMFLSNRTAVRRAKYETQIVEMDKRMIEKATRITRLEERLDRSPTHADILRVGERMEQIHSELSHLSGSVSGIKAGMDIIHAHLLEGAR